MGLFDCCKVSSLATVEPEPFKERRHSGEGASTSSSDVGCGPTVTVATPSTGQPCMERVQRVASGRRLSSEQQPHHTAPPPRGGWLSGFFTRGRGSTTARRASAPCHFEAAPNALVPPQLQTFSADTLDQHLHDSLLQPVAVLGMEPDSSVHPDKKAGKGGQGGVALGLHREGSVSGYPNASPQPKHHNKLFPLYLNQPGRDFFKVSETREYAQVLRRLLRRDPLLTFALQKALKHLNQSRGIPISHVTADPSTTSATLYGLRITPCLWDMQNGTGSVVPAILLEHNMPYDPQLVMPRLLRDYAVLSHVPSILTIIDQDTGTVLYQNAASLDYAGDLTSHSIKSGKVQGAGKLGTGMLGVLFQHEPDMLHEMLDEVLAGNYWQSIVQVPQLLKRHFAFHTDSSRHGVLATKVQAATSCGESNSLPGAVRAITVSGGDQAPAVTGAPDARALKHVTSTKRFLPDNHEPEFRLDSFTTSGARDKRNLNGMVTPSRRSMAALQPTQSLIHAGMRPSHLREFSRLQSVTLTRGIGAAAPTVPANPAELPSPAISAKSDKQEASDTSALLDNAAGAAQDGHRTDRSLPAAAPSNSGGSTHVMFNLPSSAPTRAGSPLELVPGQALDCLESGTMSNVPGSGAGKVSQASAATPNRRFMALMQSKTPLSSQDASFSTSVMGVANTSQPGAIEKGQSTGQGAGRDEVVMVLEEDCWHDVSAMPLLDPVLDKQVILLLQTNVTARVELENRLADLTDAQLSMLEQLFPRHVIEYMLSLKTACNTRNLAHLAHQHDNVVVLFTDVVGFTSMSKEVMPSQVMNFLNELFTVFDNLVDSFQLYKLDTVGDCYIIVAGMTSQDDDGFTCVGRSCAPSSQEQLVVHAQTMMDCAKAMLRESQQVLYPHNNQPVQIRVGIHCGPLASGLVGSRLPKFTLFGDTMNTASRMESTCRIGCVQVSDVVAVLLPNEEWKDTGGVQVKGKGHMQTYLWEPKPEELIPRSRIVALAPMASVPEYQSVPHSDYSDLRDIEQLVMASERSQDALDRQTPFTCLPNQLPGSRGSSFISTRTAYRPQLSSSLRSRHNQPQKSAYFAAIHDDEGSSEEGGDGHGTAASTVTRAKLAAGLGGAKSRPTSSSTAHSLSRATSMNRRTMSGRDANKLQQPLMQILSMLRGDEGTMRRSMADGDDSSSNSVSIYDEEDDEYMGCKGKGVDDKEARRDQQTSSNPSRGASRAGSRPMSRRASNGYPNRVTISLPRDMHAVPSADMLPIMSIVSEYGGTIPAVHMHS